jgi:hypothetical protein
MHKRTWFKLYRGWQQNPMFRSDRDRLNWLWLIEHTVYNDSHEISINNAPYTLVRGELSYSIRYLAQAWKTTPSYVRAFLKHLEKWHAIQTQNDTGQTVISICNYSKFQDVESQNDTGLYSNTTQGRHKDDTNNKKGKKEKKDNNIFFDDFWGLFPRQRRGDKQKGLRAFERALKKDTYENIMDGLKAYAKSDEVANGFAKGCEAWLNDSRWLNEYETKKKSVVQLEYERAKAGKYIC